MLGGGVCPPLLALCGARAMLEISIAEFAMRRLAALLCLLIPLFAVCDDGVVIPIATGEWPPFVADGLPRHGPVAEVVTAVLAEMGAKPRFIFTSWPLAEKMVESGNALAAFPYTINADRQRRFDFSVSLFDSRGMLFFDKTRRPPGFAPKQMADLHGLTVGAIHGEWFVPAMQEAGIAIDYANTYEQNVAKLTAGRIDVAPMNERLGWYYLRKLYPNDIDRFGATVHMQSGPVMTNHLIVSRSYPGHGRLLVQMNAAITKLRQRGDIEKMLSAAGL